jgi:hypothetical protein
MLEIVGMAISNTLVGVQDCVIVLKEMHICIKTVREYIEDIGYSLQTQSQE